MLMDVCCQYGRLGFVEWLISIVPDVKSDINEDWVHKCCKYGHLNLLKWSYEHRTTFGIYYDIDVIFGISCMYGRFDIAKWLYELGANIHTDDDNVFMTSCLYGESEIAHWLNQESNGYNQNIYNRALKASCQGGHLDIVEWLVSLGADIHYDNESPFIAGCENGHLEIAKWLQKQGANIHANNDAALEASLEEGQIQIVEWLYSLTNAHTDDTKIHEYRCDPSLLI
jgi:hypothetical protein